jgi:hypothetical protein
MVTVGFSGLLDVDLLLGRFQSISAIFADHGVEMTLWYNGVCVVTNCWGGLIFLPGDRENGNWTRWSMLDPLLLLLQYTHTKQLLVASPTMLRTLQIFKAGSR